MAFSLSASLLSIGLSASLSVVPLPLITTLSRYVSMLFRFRLPQNLSKVKRFAVAEREERYEHTTELIFLRPWRVVYGLSVNQLKPIVTAPQEVVLAVSFCWTFLFLPRQIIR